MGCASGVKTDVRSIVMQTDIIAKIEIDSAGRLCVKPFKKEFFGIWRLAKQVHWDEKLLFLYSPQPVDWSYFDWYKHILAVANEYNCVLCVDENTQYVNIPLPLKENICTFQS